MRAPLLASALLAPLALACSGEGGAPTPPREPPPPAPVVAARAEGETWEVALEAPGVVATGERSLGLVRILARGGMKVNEEYPTAFKPGPGTTADLGGERVALREPSGRTPCPGEPSSACELRFPLPFTPRGAGEVRIEGTLAFSVCNAEKCLVEKAPLSVVARAR